MLIRYYLSSGKSRLIIIIIFSPTKNKNELPAPFYFIAGAIIAIRESERDIPFFFLS